MNPSFLLALPHDVAFYILDHYLSWQSIRQLDEAMQAEPTMFRAWCELLAAGGIFQIHTLELTPDSCAFVIDRQLRCARFECHQPLPIEVFRRFVFYLEDKALLKCTTTIYFTIRCSYMMYTCARILPQMYALEHLLLHVEANSLMASLQPSPNSVMATSLVDGSQQSVAAGISLWSLPSLTKLESLSIHGLESFTDLDLLYLVRRNPHLESLSISQCPHITSTGIVAGLLASLSHGSARSTWNRMDGNDAMEEDSYQGIERLELHYLDPIITNSSLEDFQQLMLKGCHIRSLSLVGPGFHRSFQHGLAAHCLALNYLHISHCDKLFLNDFLDIVYHKHDLQFLNLEHCQQLLYRHYPTGNNGNRMMFVHEAVQPATTFAFPHAPSNGVVSTATMMMTTAQQVLHMQQGLVYQETLHSLGEASQEVMEREGISNMTLFLEALGQNCHMLQSLTLSPHYLFNGQHLLNIDYMILQRFCQQCQHISYLHIENILMLTDQIVKLIVSSLPRLQYLSIRKSRFVTDVALMYIQDYLGHQIRYLDVTGCSLMTKHAIENFEKHSKNILIWKDNN